MLSPADFSIDSHLSNKTKEEIIKEISQIRKNIKRKHRSMKREMADSEELWEKQLKPIAEPLKKIVEEGEKLQQQQQQQQKQELEDDLEESVIIRKRKPDQQQEEFEPTPIKRYIRAPPQGVKRKQTNEETPTPKRVAIPDYNMDQDMDNNEDTPMESEINPIEDMYVEEVYTSPAVTTGSEFLKTPKGRSVAREYILQQFKGKLAQEYFLKLIKGGKDIDHNFGVRVDGDQWMIGNKSIEIDINDLIIDGLRYTGTRGLYELIFMNNPNPYIYSEEDLDTYALILKNTNAHKVNYSSRGRVKSNRGNKYKNIISQIVARESSNLMTTYSDLVGETVTGSGIVLTDAKPNFIYYDDPNELVDRLRILKASEETGHTGHENEINSIIEELKELDSQLISVNGKGIVE